MPERADTFSDLVEDVKGGDENALISLLDLYADDLHRQARKLIGKPLRRHLDPSDLVQSIQITLILCLRKGKLHLSTPKKFLALAKTLLRRQVARQWRTLKQNIFHTTVDMRLDGTLSDVPIYGPICAQPIQEADCQEALEHILTGLNEMDQKLLRLRMSGCSTAEAARTLCAEPASLRVRLSRLRKRFDELQLGI